MAKWTLPSTPSPEDIVRAAFDQRQREEAIVRAALERAASEMDLGAHIMSHYGSFMQVQCCQDAAKSIRSLADDPETVAEIIAAAAKEKE